MKTSKITIAFILLSCGLCAAQDFQGLKPINGTQLFFTVRGKGEPVVVIHGGPGLNQSYFRPHLQQLEKQFRVIYFDQRASGRSLVPKVDSINLRFFIEDLEAIRTEFKIDKLNILAHSWGVIPAIRYALKFPDKVNKIILSNPALLSREYDKEAVARMKANTTKEDSALRARYRIQTEPPQKISVADYDQMMKLNFRSSAFNRNNIYKLNLGLQENHEKANQRLFEGLMKDPAARANLYDSLPKLNSPVLVIHGTADILPMAAIERMMKNLPNSELEIFSKSGHFPFVEENERYIQRITDFLKDK